MNVAIVDDSPEDRAALLRDMGDYAQENCLALHLTQYESGEAFLKQASLPTLDAVFLDIFMDSLSGMDVAHQLRRAGVDCQIVFLTSTPSYALESYEVMALHYMLKPYTPKALGDVLDRLDRKLQRSSRYLKVKEGRDWRRLPLSDILYADYSNHYVQLHTENGIVSTYMKFPEIEERLLVYREFMTCYRCVVVNMDRIKKVDEAFFLLCNGEYVPINRKRIREIKSQYTDYIFGMIEAGEADADG